MHGLGSLRQFAGSLFTLTGRILFTGIDMGGWCHVYWHHTPHRAEHGAWGGTK
jgi:cbb3-type cytochrome oxidase subunit 3